METKSKGKTVGCWLSGAEIDALKQALIDRPNMGEGTYGAEAIRERLRTEGYLKDGPMGRVAARALEIAKVIGQDVLERELDRIAGEHVAGAVEARS